MKLYDHKTNDSKWQKKWEEEKLYATPKIPGKKKAYILDMFPYPSGEGLHVGHPKGYIATDIYSRFKRMNGYDVLHPMGWDAFGLPAEQFALKHKIHPRVAVEKNIANFKQQLSHIGCDYDWSREINTTDPGFYKWTQWIFTKLYEKGLAYESNEPINWCPSCKTGLANEDLDGDKCERCDSVVEKKPIRQWVLRITKYADRMLSDLDTLAWPEGVKLAQKNWIGRSEGVEFDFEIADKQHEKIRVFTTRPDTLFGATFVAISAEFASSWFDRGFIKSNDIKNFITKVLEDKKKENDYTVVPEKEGMFTGVYAINPATKEKIPVWIANYVLGSVGTGAIMAVPAHDGRDYEFAKKYSIPVKEVIAGVYGEKANSATERNRVGFIIENEGKFLCEEVISGETKFSSKYILLGGGIKEGEEIFSAMKRELFEETGVNNIEDVVYLGTYRLNWFSKNRNQERTQLHSIFSVKVDAAEIAENKNEAILAWLTAEELSAALKNESPDQYAAFQKYLSRNVGVYTEDDGELINSDTFTGLTSLQAREQITKDFNGEKVVTYKIQDWVFARQRYWGEPFPVVRDTSGQVYMVDESELPVLLPLVESYEPTGTGESPLAAITDWVNVRGYITEKGTFKQSSDGDMFTRETNTMPQWAGSSWYYLRFLDPHNNATLVDASIEKAWSPVDVYVGGDHATRHLIYARFWHKFLYDIGAVSTIEPFSRLEFLGFILAEDGRKMSKRWGNIINPDDVVVEYGADTLRVYEMFMAPFEQTAAWSTSSIKGADKFLDRVYALRHACGDSSTVEVSLHKTIKKVTEDIENFKFNTAISSMMILVNEMETGSYTKDDYKNLLQILSPFAPHLTEECFSDLGETSSIHTTTWPSYDVEKTVEATVTVAFQVSGRLRGTVEVVRNLDDSALIDTIKKHEMYKKYVADHEQKKIIIVKNKIINIVI